MASCTECLAEGEWSPATYKIDEALVIDVGFSFYRDMLGFVGWCCERHFEERKAQWLAR